MSAILLQILGKIGILQTLDRSQAPVRACQGASEQGRSLAGDVKWSVSSGWGKYHYLRIHCWSSNGKYMMSTWKKILYKHLQVAIKLLHAREMMSPACRTLTQAVDLIEKLYH